MTPDIKSLLVPLDFSSTSAHALDYARALAFRFGASVHLIHVCEVPPVATASMDGFAVAYTDWSRQLGEEAEKELAKVARELDSTQVTTEVLFGNPARAIVSSATTRGADLIVMGTHGRSAIMHMLMGNVAERVVRTAPCPVLTVGEPRAKQDVAEPVPARRVAVAAAALLAALLLSPMALPAAAQDPAGQPTAEMRQRVTGRETFRTYCATCHGPSGRGDGPLATSMKTKPANLTEIAKRNGGEFPADLIFRTIDGRQRVKGHGGPDMPEWGEAFLKSRDGGSADTVKETIDSLVRFVESIQVKPVQ
jgi:nucleotide-binding universal stress UspA family protein/mono/diheme cytochrome c family protein